MTGRHVVQWLALVLILALCGGAPLAASDKAVDDYSGVWRSYWRGGQALITFTQSGDAVTGSYRPGDGEIAGTVRDGVLRGFWTEDGQTGGLIFALSDDGLSFVGRFENGEYWNGEFLPDQTIAPTPFRRADTPREALRTIVVAANATVAGEGAATLIWEPLLSYAGPETDRRDHARRNALFLRLVTRSSFRINDVPQDVQGRRYEFEIGPAGVAWTFPVMLVELSPGKWGMEAPTFETLSAWRDELLEKVGARTLDAFAVSRLGGARGALRDFIIGSASWEDGGDALALSALDLSHAPEQLREIEGALAVDYLRQIIDRIGYVIWQEIPDDNDAVAPFVLYRHAVGDIVIAPQRVEGAPTRWRFSSETIEALPDIYRAIRRLPLAQGLTAPSPLSDFFQLRDDVEAVSPALLRRSFGLENWQWIGLAGLLTASTALAWLAGRALSAGARRLVASADGPREARDAALSGFVWPARGAVMAVGALIAVSDFGLRKDVSSILGGVAALTLLLAATSFAYSVAGVAGAWAQGRAARTPGYIDEVVASLATGLAKIAIIVAAFILGAEILGLPYEGVIAGLGIGGLALAIAARDTVSNFIGAAILLADRPFRRGDLIEAAGHLATVEDVGLRSTKLRTFDDCLLVVPNSRLADDVLNNWGRRRSRRIVLLIGVTYDTPREELDRFVDRLRALWREQPRGEPTVYIGLKGFGASSLDIELWGNLRVSTYGQYVDAQHALLGDIVSLAAEMGVEFAFPTRTVHVAGAVSGPGQGAAFSPPPAAATAMDAAQ